MPKRGVFSERAKAEISDVSLCARWASALHSPFTRSHQRGAFAGTLAVPRRRADGAQTSVLGNCARCEKRACVVGQRAEVQPRDWRGEEKSGRGMWSIAKRIAWRGINPSLPTRVRTSGELAPVGCRGYSTILRLMADSRRTRGAKKYRCARSDKQESRTRSHARGGISSRGVRDIRSHTTVNVYKR